MREVVSAPWLSLVGGEFHLPLFPSRGDLPRLVSPPGQACGWGEDAEVASVAGPCCDHSSPALYFSPGVQLDLCISLYTVQPIRCEPLCSFPLP